MPIEHISVDGLFGELHHDIPMHADLGLTFLFGLNGSGKTTTLNIVNFLFNEKFNSLLRIPFATVTVKLTDGAQLRIDRTTEKNSLALQFTLEQASDEYESFAPMVLDANYPMWSWRFDADRSLRAGALASIERYLPQLHRVRPRTWQNRLTGARLTFDEVVAEFGADLPPDVLGEAGTPRWLTHFVQSVPVYFIRADRLHTSRTDATGRSASATNLDAMEAELADEGVPQTVKDFAADLSERIQIAIANYGYYSQNLESSFPSRFLGSGLVAEDAISEDEIREKYKSQAKQRAAYIRIGLLEGTEDFQLPEGTIDPDKLTFLNAYLADADMKLDQLSEFAERLELFLNVVNTKLRRKNLAVDRRSGWKVDVGGGEIIPLSALSSGEQQEIVLAYGLLFREKPGTLVLIDEPELSLHVAWQFKLIPDFLDIAKLAGLKFLIATHSPQVVNGRDDITVYLNDGVED